MFPCLCVRQLEVEVSQEWREKGGSYSPGLAAP